MTRAHLVLARLPAPDADGAARISDEELATRLARGDRDALGQIYERHAQSLYAMLVRLLGNTGEAEEILQETFVVAFHKAKQLREPAALRGWLVRIAGRDATARLVRRKRWFSFEASPADVDRTPLASSAAEGTSGEMRAELALLDRELAKLPSAERSVWILRYVEGERLEDVAAACGCSLATAKRRLAAADAAVRRHVKIEEGDDG